MNVRLRLAAVAIVACASFACKRAQREVVVYTSGVTRQASAATSV